MVNMKFQYKVAMILRFIFWYLTTLFLFSSLYLTSQFNSIGNIVIAFTILMFIPFMVLFKRDEIKFHIPTLIVMYFFALACSLSGLVNSDMMSLVNGIVFLMLYLTSFSFVHSFKGIQVNKLVFKAIFVSHIPIVFLPLLFDGVSIGAYKGIFYNPNSFGNIATTLFVSLFALFLYKLESRITGTEKRKEGLIVQLLLLFFIFFLIIMSGSRTSIIAAVAVMVVGLIFLIGYLIKARKIIPLITRGSVMGFVCTLIIVLLVKFTPIYEYLYFNILYKFERKSGDLLDGRGGAWEQTINEAGLLGRGSDFFSRTNVAAHNTFINILGETGWVSLAMFVLFLTIIAYTSTKYVLKANGDRYKYLPVMLLICFVFLSMGESMLFKLIMLTLFFSTGTTVLRRDIVAKEDLLHEKKKRVTKRGKLVWK